MKQVVYDKPFLTIDEQVERIARRGMDFPDRDRAEDLLRKVGYYRLSGYWHLFRELAAPAVPVCAPGADHETTTPQDAATAVAPGGDDLEGEPVGTQAAAGAPRASRPTCPACGAMVGDDHVGTDGTGVKHSEGAEGSAGKSRPPERRLSTFMPDTSFAEVERIYHFDRALRMHVFDALEVLEVALRARVGYLVGQGHAFAHRDPNHLHPDFTGQGRSQAGMEYSGWLDSGHADWLRHVDREESRSAEPFVTHIRQKYNSPLPVWAATEVMSFGTLGRLYSGMDRAQKNRVAASLGLRGAREVGEGSTLANWLDHLRYVRNTCAHHARLWNRNMTVQLAETSRIDELVHLDRRCRSRVYGTLAVLSFLLARVDPANSWRLTVAEFIESGTKDIRRPMSAMGFPDDWRNQKIWGESYTHPDPEWEKRQDLLDRLPSVSAGEMGRLMRPKHTSKAALSYMRYLRQKGFMLGLPEGNTYVYPQFQVDSSNLELYPVVARVNQRLLGDEAGADAALAQWRCASWWSTRRDDLARRSPVEELAAGRLTDEVVDRLLPG